MSMWRLYLVGKDGKSFTLHTESEFKRGVTTLVEGLKGKSSSITKMGRTYIMTNPR